jgi:hypothetical protein
LLRHFAPRKDDVVLNAFALLYVLHQKENLKIDSCLK